ncbi:23S rRNA (guanosine(2251)-2'-O)-methyltransferase RlmB [candidate division KSB1 bacterium]|nr:23S rRNA (guanosine(2251)-2'-O)-methyltransferase RlmB [candidate division KSB1 bacterium]
MIYGKNPVKEWLAARLPVKRILLSKESAGKALDEMVKIAGELNLKITYMSRHQMDTVTGSTRHQGVAAEIKLPPYAEMERIFQIAGERNEPPIVVILDGIQDPHNLGAIVRTADAGGIHGVIIPKDRSAGISPGMIKASAGAVAHVPVVQVINIARCLDELKKKGLWVVGTDQHGDMLYTKTDFRGSTAIILGSEDKGMRRLIREKSDFLVRVPMYGQVDSLNVSVTAGLLIFEARRQRDNY